jgi:hypothetical protein
MVSHPSIAGANVENLYYHYYLNQLYAMQGRTSTNALADMVREEFQYDAQLSDQFNHMLDNKWDGMMTQPNIGYTYWNDPVSNTMPNITYLRNSNVSSGEASFGVALQTEEYSTKGGKLVNVGPSMNIDKDHPIRWAMAVDDMKPKVITPLWDHVLSPPSPNSENAIAGMWSNWTMIPSGLAAGQHQLKMWSLDAGLVLEKMVIDLGGAQRSFLGVPESWRS